jgi:hypothetical protein
MLGRYMIRFIDERTVKRKTKRNRAKARLIKTRTVLRRFLTMFLYITRRYFMIDLYLPLTSAGQRV